MIFVRGLQPFSRPQDLTFWWASTRQKQTSQAQYGYEQPIMQHSVDTRPLQSLSCKMFFTPFQGLFLCLVKLQTGRTGSYFTHTSALHSGFFKDIFHSFLKSDHQQSLDELCNLTCFYSRRDDCEGCLCQQVFNVSDRLVSEWCFINTSTQSSDWSSHLLNSN